MATRKPKADTAKVTHVHFPSVYASRHDAERGEWRMGANEEKARGHMASTSESFVGAPNGAAGVFARLANGYPEGEAMVQGFIEPLRAILPRAVGINRRTVRGDAGDALDIHAVNRGNLDKAWSKSVRLVRPGKTSITLVVDICGNAYSSSEELTWRGVAALAVSEVMSKAGYNVELMTAIAANAFVLGSNNNYPVLITTTIKNRQGFADTSLLAAIVCSSGYFRTIGFANIVRCVDNMGRVNTSGIGKAVPAESYMPANDKVSQLIVPNSVASRETATSWAKQTIMLLQGATS